MSDYFELVSSRESAATITQTAAPPGSSWSSVSRPHSWPPRPATLSRGATSWSTTPEKSPLVAAATQTAGLNKFTNNCPAFVIVCEEDAYLIGRQGAEPEIRPHRYRPCRSLSCATLPPSRDFPPASWAPSTRRCCWTAWASPSPNGCCWWLQSAMPPPTRCAPKSANRSTR